MRRKELATVVAAMLFVGVLAVLLRRSERRLTPRRPAHFRRGRARPRRSAHPGELVDRARRRGDLPRLRRRRLDVPLARASRPRLPSPGRARPPRPARRRGGRATPSTAPACSTPRIVQAPAAATEADLRELRYALTADEGLRATGHTASDQVETVLYRIVSSGSTRGIRPRREDGVVRPLLPLWREETEAYCRAQRPLLAGRRQQRGDEARADPRADPAAPRGARPARPREPPRARGRRAAAAAPARGVARRASLLA